MKTVPLISVLLTRDSMTRVPTQIPPYELELVQVIFGEENVQTNEEVCGEIEVEPAEEGERLAKKYGVGQVIRVYGEAFKGAITRAVNAIEATPKAAKGRAAAPA